MHEVGLCQGVVDAALKRAHGRTVTALRVRVGSDHHVSEQELQGLFPLLAAGTEAADARLDVVVVQGDELVLESIALAAT